VNRELYILSITKTMSGDGGRPTALGWGKSPLHEQGSPRESERIGNATETTQPHYRNDRRGRDVSGGFDETSIPAGAIPSNRIDLLGSGR